jgi:hypothetical protein
VSKNAERERETRYAIHAHPVAQHSQSVFVVGNCVLPKQSEPRPFCTLCPLSRSHMYRADVMKAVTALSKVASSGSFRKAPALVPAVNNNVLSPAVNNNFLRAASAASSISQSGSLTSFRRVSSSSSSSQFVRTPPKSAKPG